MTRGAWRRTGAEMRAGAVQYHPAGVSLTYVRRSPDAPWAVSALLDDGRGEHLRTLRHDTLSAARASVVAMARAVRAAEAAAG